MLPGVAGPSFIARFTRTGNGVEPPGFFAGCGVEGGDESANAVFSARSTNDDLVLHNERSNGDRVARSRISAVDVHIPYGLSIVRVDRNYMAVDGAHEHRVAK